ncbi:MAG: outer membrane protein assembly factor BamE [Acidobacteriota bacterium]|nr:outer membrane protein assembly factor BamE [Acidobacteriota bacterium]
MRRLALVIIFSLGSTRLHADSKKLTEDQRIEILRGLSSEYAKIKVVLPRSKKALEFSSDGTWVHDVWDAAFKEFGPAGRVGDLIQVTRVEIDKDRVVLDLNGGMKSGKRFLDHVQIGMGNSTSPVTGAATNAPGGTTIALIFGGPIGETTSADIKKMLLPVLDFEKSSVTENYVDTLPEPIKEAVKAKKAIEGMNRDQVLLAVGRPVRKTRESKEGTDYEDWIYGEPPGRVTFVTFTGDKVVKVKETYAGLGGSLAETPQQP